jgi:hypothetical protein
MRALPSGVLGPVDRPPCSRQRVLPVSGGFWQAVPRRVLAPQLWRGRSGPKRHLLPASNLTFVTAKTLAFIGPIIPDLRQHCEAPVASSNGCEPSKINLILFESTNTIGQHHRQVARWALLGSGAPVDPSGHRVSESRIQAQWPLQTPRRAINRRTDSAGPTAHLRGQSQARAADQG